MIRSMVALVIALCLSACGQITDRLGVKDPFGIPKPFEGKERNPALTARITESPSFLVGGIDGMAGEPEDALRRDVAAALQERDIVAAVSTPAAGAWLLMGRIKERQLDAPVKPKSSERPHTIARKSRLKGGKPGPSLVDKPPIPETPISRDIEWTVLDEKAAQRASFATPMTPGVAVLAAARLSEWVEAETVRADAAKPDAPAMEPLPKDTNQVAVVQAPHAALGEVTGAPGDGNQALAGAMGLMLANTGVKMTATDDVSAWRVSAAVRVEAQGAKDKVTLDWRVTDAKGVAIGNLQQKNEVAAKSLAKNWGETAALAAAAAAPGLAEIIAKAHNAGLDPQDVKKSAASSPTESRKP